MFPYLETQLLGSATHEMSCMPCNYELHVELNCVDSSDLKWMCSLHYTYLRSKMDEHLETKLTIVQILYFIYSDSEYNEREF